MAFPLASALTKLLDNGPLLVDASQAKNPRVLASLLGPAYRGLLRRRGDVTDLQPGGSVFFDWRYRREMPEMARLYEAAKSSQWNGAEDLDWSREVDPFGKRRAQAGVAAAELRRAQAETTLAERTLIVNVKSAAANLFAAQETEALGAVQVEVAGLFRTVGG